MFRWFSLFFPVSSFTLFPFLSLFSFYVSLFPPLSPSFSPKFYHPHLFPYLPIHAALYLLILTVSHPSLCLPHSCLLVFSSHYSLFPPISSNLTPIMTPRSFCPADYAKGFGGQYGIQKDRVDKVKYQNTNFLRIVS